MSGAPDNSRAGLALEPKQERSRATRRLLLDAAVHELLDHGYAGLTTLAVARRAGVSRGAQQNHFPNKSTLVAEALGHLAEQELARLHDVVAHAPEGPRERVGVALDMIFREYGGALFAVVMELSLASRDAPELRAVVAEQEQAMAGQVDTVARAIFGPELMGRPGFPARWGMALAAIRGEATLKLLGHADESVERRWQRTRNEVIDVLLA